jgi:hypothetical protein
LAAVPTDLKRPTTVEVIVAAVKRESEDALRLAVLIMLMVLIGALGLSVGYLIGLKDVDAAAVEAAGTWFGALVSLGAVVIAARVFLSDKLFQDYQLAADREREREERAERDQYLAGQASQVALDIDVTYGPGALTTEVNLEVRNRSNHTMFRVQVAVPFAEDRFAEVIHPHKGANFTIYGGDRKLGDLRQDILRETTVTFTQNDRRWIWHAEKATELVESNRVPSTSR